MLVYFYMEVITNKAHQLLQSCLTIEYSSCLSSKANTAYRRHDDRSGPKYFSLLSCQLFNGFSSLISVRSCIAGLQIVLMVSWPNLMVFFDKLLIAVRGPLKIKPILIVFWTNLFVLFILTLSKYAFLQLASPKANFNFVHIFLVSLTD